MNRFRFLTLSVLLLSLLATVSLACASDSKHAFFGVVAGEITSELASDYGVQPGMGVIVESVTNESPADKLGLRTNDVITTIDGTRITGPEEFRVQIRKHKPSDAITVAYVRGGKERTGSATLEKQSDENFNFSWSGSNPVKAWAYQWGNRDKDGSEQGYAGLYLQELSDGLRGYFKVEDGVLISEVVDGSPADKAGLKSGDVIVRLDGEEVDNESEIRREIRAHKPGESLNFTVKRDGAETTISVKLGSVDEGEDMGDNSIMRWDGVDPDFDVHIEGLENLDDQIKDLHIQLDDLRQIAPEGIEMPELPTSPIQLEMAPDAPTAPEPIEIRKARPIWDRTVWLESWERVKQVFNQQMSLANQQLAKFREQLNDLRERVKERFA